MFDRRVDAREKCIDHAHGGSEVTWIDPIDAVAVGMVGGVESLVATRQQLQRRNILRRE